MTDADRLPKARRDAEARRRDTEAKSRAAAAEGERRESLRAINSLVPQVLQALAQRGYPDSKLVRIKTLFGSKERAGWPVGGISSWVRDGDVYSTCYLLSTEEFTVNGYFNSLHGSNPCRASETGVAPQEIEAGLRALLKQYSG
jgi:hypothetical protein